MPFNNFLGQHAEEILCGDLNTPPTECILKETHRVAVACEILSIQFVIVCKQSSCTRKKNAKFVYFKKLRILVLVTVSNDCKGDVHNRKKTKKTKKTEKQYSKFYRLNSQDYQNVWLWKRPCFESVPDEDDKDAVAVDHLIGNRPPKQALEPFKIYPVDE